MSARAQPGQRLLVATGNRGKLAEFAELLAPLVQGAGLELVSLAALPHVTLPPEGEDYAENAAAKARAAAAASGLPALADDSGIEVTALGGAPGPRSARYGGPGLDDAGRSALLLRAVAESGSADRSARFVCVAALSTPGGEVELAHGECRGTLLAAPRGAAGFGYDPIFAPAAPLLAVAERPLAMAELPAAEKNRISHRARALAALAPALARCFAR